MIPVPPRKNQAQYTSDISLGITETDPIFPSYHTPEAAAYRAWWDSVRPRTALELAQQRQRREDRRREVRAERRTLLVLVRRHREFLRRWLLALLANDLATLVAERRQRA
jgi:hypothetical protein